MLWDSNIFLCPFLSYAAVIHQVWLLPQRSSLLKRYVFSDRHLIRELFLADRKKCPIGADLVCLLYRVIHHSEHFLLWLNSNGKCFEATKNASWISIKTNSWFTAALHNAQQTLQSVSVAHNVFHYLKADSLAWKFWISIKGIWLAVFLFLLVIVKKMPMSSLTVSLHLVSLYLLNYLFT